MSESLQVAIVVLVAVLVGAFLPLLFQLRATLKQAQDFLSTASHQLEVVMGETGETLAKVNHIASDLERSVTTIADTLEQSRKTLHTLVTISASLGPAVAAAVQALQQRREARGPTAAPPPNGGT